MPKVIKYAGVLTGTLTGGGGAVASKKIPCFMAREVILVARATGGAFTVGAFTNNQSFVFAADTGWFGAAAVTLTDGIGGKQITGNGAVSAWNSSSGLYIQWGYLSFNLAPNATPGNDVTGVTVDAYVCYDGDRDKLDMGQDAAVPI